MRSRRLIVATVAAAGLIALTHFGTETQTDSFAPESESSSSPSAALGPDAETQVIALRALDAERVFYVDNVRYGAGAGAELAELRRADPGIRWGRDVIVVEPASEGENGQVAAVRAASPTGRVFCAAEVSTPEDAGTWFAATVEAPCPAIAPEMPGWNTDQTIGWL